MQKTKASLEAKAPSRTGRQRIEEYSIGDVFTYSFYSFWLGVLVIIAFRL